MEKKLCKKCGIEKALCEFRMKKDKNGKYYLYSYCKICEKEYMKDKRKKYDKKYREKNKEIIKQKIKKDIMIIVKNINIIIKNILLLGSKTIKIN